MLFLDIFNLWIAAKWIISHSQRKSVNLSTSSTKSFHSFLKKTYLLNLSESFHMYVWVVLYIHKTFVNRFTIFFTTTFITSFSCSFKKKNYTNKHNTTFQKHEFFTISYFKHSKILHVLIVNLRILWVT